MQRQQLKKHSSASPGCLSKHYSEHKFCFGSFHPACTVHFKWEEGNPQYSFLSCSLLLHPTSTLQEFGSAQEFFTSLPEGKVIGISHTKLS